MKKSYLNALHEHRLGNLDVAEKLYLGYLKEDPENHDLLHLLSILLAQRNDFLNARFYAERALNSEPDSATLHNSMGNIMHNLNEHEVAITHYKTSLELHPGNASAYNNLGNIYYHKGELDEASKHYLKAADVRPHYVDAHYNLGLVLTKQDEKEDAKKHLELVLNIEPDHLHAHSNLGYLFQSQGDFDRAKHHYQKSLESNAGIILSYHNLGVIFVNKGDYDKAMQCFNKVLEMEPEHKEALHNLGAVFLLQGKSQEALPFLLRLSRLGDDFDIFYNLGSIYLNLRLLDEAVSYFNKALRLSPNDFATNVNLGAIYLKRRDYDMAEKYYQYARYIHPENEEVRHMLTAIQQKNASSSPVAYIKNLFDQYSTSFEEHAEALGYKAPEVLYEALKPEFFGREDLLSVLDLGCGTGLGGIRFNHLAKRLIGIDISEKMLGLAAKKGVYTDLRLGPMEENIKDFFDIDLIIAADSLVYLGDLSEIFSRCYAAMKEAGLFAFTVEINNEIYPYHLQRSIRFAHSERYIQELALQNDFSILFSKKVILRKHGEGVIEGAVFVFKK